MSDRRLRELERRWNESDSPEDRKNYDMARKRMGLTRLPRDVVRHYVEVAKHGICGPDGLIASRLDNWTSYRPGRDKVSSACSVELWPRDLYSRLRGWKTTLRKEVFYTEDTEEVTCKKCLQFIDKPAYKNRRKHYAPGSKIGVIRDDAGQLVVTPVCGRDDSEKFEETYCHTMAGVNCPSCKRIMCRGRIASRRPRSTNSR